MEEEEKEDYLTFEAFEKALKEHMRFAELEDIASTEVHCEEKIEELKKYVDKQIAELKDWVSANCLFDYDSNY